MKKTYFTPEYESLSLKDRTMLEFSQNMTDDGQMSAGFGNGDSELELFK